MNITFNDTQKDYKYTLAGHGKTNFSILKNAIANIPDDADIDCYGEGDIIENFEKKVAKILGKEKARFYPTGTMAQQNALRVFCDKSGTKTVALHPLAHLEEREKYGIQKLHNIKTILVGTEDRIFTLEDLKAIKEDYSVVLIELPARDFGGEMLEWEELVEMRDYLKSKNIKFHLDGARIWEAQPYFNKPLDEICSLFDAVYVSLYKGIGGLSGAVLAGDDEFIEECKIWQRRSGGNLVYMYPFVAVADYYFDDRLANMGKYWLQAKDLASRFNELEGFRTLPITPKSNMFHLFVEKDAEEIKRLFTKVYDELGLSISTFLGDTPNGYRREISIGDAYSNIPVEVLNKTFEILKKG